MDEIGSPLGYYMSANKRNRFLLLQSISLGALTFPTPFLIFLYLFNIYPAHESNRVIIILFLMLSGSLIGLVSYFRNFDVQNKKDWVPSKQEGRHFLGRIKKTKSIRLK